MIRTIAAALAAFALVSFSAIADDAKPADTKAETKADAKPAKKSSKKHSKKDTKDAAKTDAAAPATK
jgi:hypothetical protein